MAQEMSKYAAAGVNIDAGNEAVKRIKQHARSTFNPNVLTDLGFFGSLYQMPDDSNKVLVSSVDGVGTKLKMSVRQCKRVAPITDAGVALEWEAVNVAA